jgi:hypothetical protein
MPMLNDKNPGRIGRPLPGNLKRNGADPEARSHCEASRTQGPRVDGRRVPGTSNDGRLASKRLASSMHQLRAQGQEP